MRGFGQLVVLRDAGGGGLPAGQRGVDGLDGAEAADVGRDDVGELAVDLVVRADRDLFTLVHDVHLGDDEPLGRVDHVGVAEEREIEPAGAAWAARDGAVLVAAGAQQLTLAVGDLCRKWTFSDAGDVGLGDTDDRADACGADAGASDRAAGCAVGARHKGICPMVDVEQSTLGALEHDVLAFIDGFV